MRHGKPDAEQLRVLKNYKVVEKEIVLTDLSGNLVRVCHPVKAYPRPGEVS